jgi:hypothetical protein
MKIRIYQAAQQGFRTIEIEASAQMGPRRR